jgi:hypothetical protein
MKGRYASFQRFGSVLGVQGSVVSKWPVRKNAIRADGIYKETLKFSIKDSPDFENPDSGEEVYGCIASGYTAGTPTPTIEYSAEVAQSNRKTREAYASGTHFKADGNEWSQDDKDFTDSACIVTENIPLVVNSKFPMKWKENSVPSGVGFTSGALVRPLYKDKEGGFHSIGLSDSAGEAIPDGANGANGSAHTIRGIPIAVAHRMLNCCKEISLEGSVSRNYSRSSKRCSGKQSTTQIAVKGTMMGYCPPGNCISETISTTLECISGQQTTDLAVNGSIKMTAYRYKQVHGIWKDPKASYISPNYLYGTLGTATLMKFSSASCDDYDYGSETEDPNATPTATIEQLAVLEKQEKLTAGCLVYPYTNRNFLLADEEDNLKTKEIDFPNCIKGGSLGYELINASLVTGELVTGERVTPNFTDGGDTDISPALVSGPSLVCSFNGNGFDYSGVGKGGAAQPIDIGYDCFPKENNYIKSNAKWNSTGLKATLKSGKCSIGIQGISRYGANDAECECGDSCASCTPNYGKLGLDCECAKRCFQESSFGSKSDACAGERQELCDVGYGIGFTIGKHIGAKSPSSNNYSIKPLPLSVKAATEDLTIFFVGSVGNVGNSLPWVDLPLYPNVESANRFKQADNSVYRYETKSIGTLKLVCEEWSTSFPLWTLFAIAKEKGCIGSNLGANSNYVARSVEDVLYTGCEGCGGENCCSAEGCGGFAADDDPTFCCKSVFCSINDPCFAAAVAKSNFGKECLGQPTCEADCEGDKECGCCDCDDGESGNCPTCPEYSECKSYIEKDFEEIGCYDNSAHSEDTHNASVNLTITFKLFTETE